MAQLLRRGSRGNEVADLQAALNFHIRSPEIPLSPDGIFGPKTDARLRMFQSRAKIKPDGIAGPETFRFLYHAITGTVSILGQREESSFKQGSSFQLWPREWGPILHPLFRRSESEGAFSLPLLNLDRLRSFSFDMTLTLPWPVEWRLPTTRNRLRLTSGDPGVQPDRWILGSYSRPFLHHWQGLNFRGYFFSKPPSLVPDSIYSIFSSSAIFPVNCDSTVGRSGNSEITVGFTGDGTLNIGSAITVGIQTTVGPKVILNLDRSGEHVHGRVTLKRLFDFQLQVRGNF